MLLTSALYCVLAFASFRADPMRPEIAGEDWVGPVGASLAGWTVGALGTVAWFLPLELALLAAPLVGGRRWLDGHRRTDEGAVSATVSRLGGDVVVAVVLAAIGHVAFPDKQVFGAMPLGGAVGELFGEILRGLFSSVGSYIIGLTVVALILIGRATFSFIQLVQRIEHLVGLVVAKIVTWARSLLGAWTAAREIERREADEDTRAPRIERHSTPDAIIAALSDEDEPSLSSSTPIAVAAEEPPVSWAEQSPLQRSAPSEVSSPKPKRPRRTRGSGQESAEEAASATTGTLAMPDGDRLESHDPPESTPAIGTMPSAKAIHEGDRRPADTGPKITTTPAMLPFTSSDPMDEDVADAASQPRPMTPQDDDVPTPSPILAVRTSDLIPSAPQKGKSKERRPRNGRHDTTPSEKTRPLASANGDPSHEEQDPFDVDAEDTPPSSRAQESLPMLPLADHAPASSTSLDDASCSVAWSDEPSLDEEEPPAGSAHPTQAEKVRDLEAPKGRRPLVEKVSAASVERTQRYSPAASHGPEDAATDDAVTEAEGSAPQAVRSPGSPRTPEALQIIDTRQALQPEKAERVKVIPSARKGFALPATDMLESAQGGRMQIDEEQLKAMAQLLEKTLADYGVSGKVEEIHPGPTVTTFEVSPAPGTKVSKVAGLADDLALGLSRKVRIVAPIPGKNRIGFEIPNEQRLPVNLRELVEDRRFVEMKSPLPCVLGRDIIGTPYFADLASMPHVIVAGATGAGKSVGLNVMLVSLLFRKTPEDLRLLMIDPKVVELAPFDRIPHMLLPVVTDMKQAATALKWAVDEMERRYQLFANAGTKNITTYNGWVERVRRGEAKPPRAPARVTAVAPDGTDVEVDAARDGSDVTLPEKLPFIVIVVDEFADLMMQQGKDVEASVARLAQKARAAGMHVILATQRPSVDVITGMIKANFPTRVAFRVAQKVDSRTILDEQGAEHLLGRGDMLIKMNGANETRRVQCPFCSEEEVQRITDFLRSQGEPVYDEAILAPRDEDGAEADATDLENDAMYDAAVRIVADTRRCSTSWIQRKLGIGYNRAAKLVEAMEKRGLVGPANGAKDREVLISPV
ncbi:uncharacterized protein CMC5_007160 [Chondromyces crocatus]|uniref:FtsK domain-containing protein n=1 Tax=Chondromyces crocatus TaxID=52 RepID=A0A0K1E7R6_CHOCO|nr:uncharacterized protein CMC5_007160 [Chondromyces crocatus]